MRKHQSGVTLYTYSVGILRPKRRYTKDYQIEALDEEQAAQIAKLAFPDGEIKFIENLDYPY